MARRRTGVRSSASATPWRRRTSTTSPAVPPDAGEQQVLAGGDPNVELGALDDLGQGAGRPSVTPPALHRHTEEPAAVVLAVPAQVVVLVPRRQLGRERQAAPKRCSTSGAERRAPAPR